MRRTPLTRGSSRGPRTGRYDGRFALLLIAPAFFFYTVFLILPLFGTVVIGFTDWTGINFATLRFTGLENFIQMAGDEFFWVALRNSFLFVICCLIFQVGIALLFAIILESGPRFARLFRSIFFVPFVISLVVVGILFNFLLDPTLGIVDILLRSIGLDGPKYGWLGTTTLNVFVVIAVHIWRDFGFTMFLLIAGLQAIPRELQESARLDGASPWQLSTRITIPLLREVLVVAAVITSISAMRVFDLVYTLTGGGPYHSSETVVTYIYQLGLGGARTQHGYATAIALVLVLIILAMSTLQFSLARAGRGAVTS
ncbi:MAG: sugar ABC transporter permease [Caldilineaceae bacterium]|nr:sugar ABC transporter permease [Caldilineaceae bacterium]MCY4118607.1 sugar ABC transporter permease [Caldilineaceae bacterium]MDE0430603.1 sugar ABC transporter permease [Caldilineaceae bacterium]